ncbi:MAG: flagellar hook protein FlgE [Rhizobiaceae bacterium]|nr:flagellar hook protein FlgE [Rhizobiaceae bacterium]
MSLFGMMRTGVSGMAAQATRLGTVADNIANSSTTGYKKAKAEFSTLVIPSNGGTYASGGVTSNVQNNVSKQGVLQYTTSTTDLAVSGQGFFIVQDSSGVPFLTRAGSFVPDGQGRLVNAAGYQLMGYSYAGGAPTVTANGFDGLEAVTVSQASLVANPSTAGTLAANLPESAAIVPAGSLPSDNVVGSQYSSKTSLVAYGDLGGEIMLDVYFTKTAANTWEVAVFDRAQATAGTFFPYGAAPLATQTLDFDGTTGQLTALSATDITIPVPGGQNLLLNMGAMTQLTSGFTLYDAFVNGNAPSSIEQVEISENGTVFAQYSDGSLRALYRIPLANVQSPDRLQSLPGNVFSQSSGSGTVRIGFPTEGEVGKVVSGALESSNVDIAEELTTMIESQRSYTANSKVFQTGSELMEILVNLKR